MATLTQAVQIHAVALVLSKLVSRRLIFLIGFANRQLWWVRYSDRKNRLGLDYTDGNSGISDDFSRAEQRESK
jgi:hypothetical protein